MIPDTDQQFLQRPFRSVERPVRACTGVKRLLFSPGAGLGLGDQFMTVAMIHTLRFAYREARIFLLTDYPQFWRPFADTDVTVIERAPGDGAAVLRERDNPYDLALLGYFPGCAAKLAAQEFPTVFCAGTNLAAFRAFYAAGGVCHEIPLDTCRQTLYEGNKFVALLADFGVEPPPPAYRETPSDGYGPAAKCPSRLGDARVLIHPGAGKAYKCWPVDRWAEVARLLLAAGATVTLSSGHSPDDATTAAFVAQAVPGVLTARRCDLPHFLNLLTHQDLVLSADTFLQHAAAALGRPISVTLYGPTDPLRYCPSTAVNHFLTPLSLSPQDVVDGLQSLLQLHAGDIGALTRPGAGRLLLDGAEEIGALKGELIASPTGRAARRVAARLDDLEDLVRDRHRLPLIGDEVQRARLREALLHGPPAQRAQALEQSAAFRTARVALRHIGSVAGQAPALNVEESEGTPHACSL